MIVMPVLAIGFILKTLAVLFILCSVILVLVILIQKGKGGGLTAALGGGMASGILGSKTGDFLTWVTIVLVGVFLSLAVVLAKFYKPTVSDYGTGQTAPQTQPAETPPEDTEQPVPSEPSTVPTADVNEGLDVNAVEQ
jgi:preprotein translocase subunit SecG